jgi:hypothetical protein
VNESNGPVLQLRKVVVRKFKAAPLKLFFQESQLGNSTISEPIGF